MNKFRGRHNLPFLFETFHENVHKILIKLNKMKTYKFEITINEGCDEFWEEITQDGKSGCDEILDVIREEMQNYDIQVRLIGYEDR